MTPILSCKSDKGVAYGNGKLLNHKEYLVHNSCSAERILTIGSEHEIICHINAVSHDVLKRNGEHHRKQSFIKRLVLCKE